MDFDDTKEESLVALSGGKDSAAEKIRDAGVELTGEKSEA